MEAVIFETAQHIHMCEWSGVGIGSFYAGDAHMDALLTLGKARQSSVRLGNPQRYRHILGPHCEYMGGSGCLSGPMDKPQSASDTGKPSTCEGLTMILLPDAGITTGGFLVVEVINEEGACRRKRLSKDAEVGRVTL